MLNGKSLQRWGLMLALASAGAPSAWADALPIVVIDEFSSGPLHQEMPADWTPYYQSTGDVLGGVRQTNLYSDDTLGGSSRVDIGDHRLLVSSSIGSLHGIFLGYGYDAAGNDGDLHADFSGYDHFQLDFEASDLSLGYLIEVWDGAGNVGLLSGEVNTASQSEPFSAELALAQFQATDASGEPRDIDWSDIRYVIVLFQSGSARGGNDYALRSIRVVPRADAASP